MAYIKNKVKGRFHPITGPDSPERAKRYSFSLALNSALEVGGCSTPRPGGFTPGKDPVPIV
jgi:hypothetical protein